MQSEGVTGVVVSSAEAAREYLEEHTVDLIFSDNDLGRGRSGVEFGADLQRASVEAGSNRPRFVIVTAKHEAFQGQHLPGVDAVVGKQPNITGLVRAQRAIIEQQRQPQK
jgi:CheY-like chemotaxis protein